MSTEPEFRTDLYQGTAPYYDRFRPAYPEALFADLRRRLPVSGRGRLLDLACGTGQIALALASDFTEVIAVDQEDETVRYGRAKARTAGIANTQWVTGSADTVAVGGSFELVAIGNAFHRLKRAAVAERTRSWLEPGGAMALLWGDTPPQGDRPWQQALQELFIEWMSRAGTSDRIPTGWDAAIEADPHEEVLRRAGLDYAGRFEFVTEEAWTVETLIGFTYSTSMLNRKALGGLSEAFERHLAERLTPYSSGGVFPCTASYAYELARRPTSP